MRWRYGLVTLLFIGGCTETAAPEPAEAVTQKTSALAGPSAGPLVMGLALNGTFLYSPTQPGAFTASSLSPFAQGDALAATDLDNNGTVEIVRGLADGGVLFFNQAGTPVSQASLGIKDFIPYSRQGALAIGDVNGDGVADVVSATVNLTTGSGSVSVAVANNAPSIPTSAVNQLPFPVGAALVVCDFDGDQVDDIIVAPSFTMYSGKTGAISHVPGAPAFFQAERDKLACGDLNNDGFDDLIMGTPQPVGGGDFIVITAPGRGPINYFTSTNTLPLSSPEDEIAAGDLDGDGFAEVVLSHVATAPGGAVFIISAPGKTPPASPVFASPTLGSKLALPAHTHPVPPPTTTNVTVPYLVAYILYEPPGDASSVNYSTGTSLGTSETITSTTSEGVNLSIKVPVSQLVSITGGESLTFNQSMVTTNSLTTSETTAVTQKASSGNDVPDHTFDQYFMIFNVKGTETDPHNGQPPTVTLDMTTGTLAPVLAAYIQEIAQSQPSTIIDPTLQALVSGAITTQQEAAQLLALDPNFTGEDVTANPDRFVPFIPTGQTTNVVPLPHPTGTNQNGKPPGATTVNYTGTTATATGQGTGNGVQLMYTGSLGIGPLTLGGSYSVSVNDVTTTTNTTTNADSITLGSDHLCEQGSISLYRDMAYGGSFLTRQTLTNPCQQEPMKMMSFEALADWTVQGGASAALNGFAVSGAESFSITASPAGWTPMVSVPVSSALLRAAATSSNLSKVSFAIDIPTAQPNKFWIGAAQMYVTSASANIFNAYMGQVELTGLPQNQFVRLGFTIPSYALPALAQDHPDVVFTIVLNVNAGTSGWLVDDLQIGG